MSKKSIEEKYQKKTQLEHILLRPDSYVGDDSIKTEYMWIYDNEKIIKKEIKYVPALYKIFDEILVNASDHSHNDNSCDIIKVNICKESNTISVFNNGNGIDVVEHAIHKIYIPELLFGDFLTSSNYDDTEKRTTGGRNGFGAKLTNAFSTFFSIETVDNNRKLKFYQEFENNLSKRSNPVITSTKENSYTKITFKPDLSKFKLKELSEDIANLMGKRVLDIAGINNKLKVYLNDKKIDINSFKKYIQLYEIFPDDNNNENNENDETDEKDEKDNSIKIIYEESDRWKIGILYTPDSIFEHMTFVNSICTYHGGSHLEYIINQIIKKIEVLIQKKYKDIKLKSSTIKDNLFIFIDSIIDNPAFTSQTKETLKTKISDFGTSYEISDKIIKKLVSFGILDQLINTIKLKEDVSLKKTDGKKTTFIKGIPKLEDANFAGDKKKSVDCKLILTEGDSAKALAMSGLSVVKSEYYGVFPLKGKLLNVRDASPKQLLENEEITNIKKILGLQHNKEYKDVSELRYGGIILMCDQDTDGFHIKGLLMNFFHYMWPSLLNNTDFIFALATPIVKAIKGNNKKIFYTMSEYLEWKDTDEESHNYRIKYYKGLGTSTKEEAKEYFSNIENKLIKYRWGTYNKETIYKKIDVNNPSRLYEDGKLFGVKQIYDNPSTEAITLAFDKKRANCRKSWLINYDQKRIMSNDLKIVEIENFVNKELIHFAKDDIQRSIPSLVDGFKISLRKIFFGTISRKLFLPKDEIKVSQLSGYVADKSSYHHGEASLNGAIIGMAQNYVGSNNINILHPSGQFGCLDPNTPILMWDKKLKLAKDVKIDDELVGDDGEKRTVLLTTNGIDDMYEIIDDKNNILVVNSSHILTLYYEENGIIKRTKKRWYVYLIRGSRIVRYTAKKLETLQSLVLNMDNRNLIDIKVDDYLKIRDNAIKDKLYLINNDKKINWEYSYDDLGYYFNNYGVIENSLDTIKISIDDINTINKIILISKSLGLVVFNINLNTIVITGKYMNKIPFKIQLQNNYDKYIYYNKFNIKYIGKNNFCGWQIDKNQRFLLGNFIITHNSRLIGGKDSASPRYIFTYLEDIIKYIFKEEDNHILNYLDDDGILVEPEWYCPIIPMILVNGSEGIGTGFSTFITQYNPIDIVNNLKLLMEEKDLIEMLPYYKNFNGNVIKIQKNEYMVEGKYEILENSTIKITELPIRTWTTSYKEFIEKKSEKIGKNLPLIDDYKCNYTDEKIDFTLKLNSNLTEKINDKEFIMEKLKLKKSVKVNNMHLYNADGNIKKYNSTNEILKEFYDIRLKMYSKRKEYLLNKLNHELNVLKWKKLFIEKILSNDIIIYKQKKISIINKLEELNFPKLSNNNYDYITDTPLFNLTEEKIQELTEKLKNKEQELHKIQITSEKEQWIYELNEFIEKYNIWLNTNNNHNSNTNNLVSNKKKNITKKK